MGDELGNSLPHSVKNELRKTDQAVAFIFGAVGIIGLIGIGIYSLYQKFH